MRQLLVAALGSMALLVAGCGGSAAGPADGGAGSACAAVICPHGVCAVAGGAALCVCDESFHAQGLTCVANDVADPCSGVSCSGRGTCGVTGGRATCTCSPGYHAEGSTTCLAGDRTGDGGPGDASPAVCVVGERRACAASGDDCTGGEQTCVQKPGDEFAPIAWGECVGASACPATMECVAAACCYSAGAAPWVSGGVMAHPPFTHCITDPVEAQGFSIGRIITPSDADLSFGVAAVAAPCCSKKVAVLSYTADFCPYGMWELRCTQ